MIKLASLCYGLIMFATLWVIWNINKYGVSNDVNHNVNHKIAIKSKRIYNNNNDNNNNYSNNNNNINNNMKGNNNKNNINNFNNNNTNNNNMNTNMHNNNNNNDMNNNNNVIDNDMKKDNILDNSKLSGNNNNKNRFHHKKLENPAVVVLAYNRPKYLEWTLRSLMNLSTIDDYSIYVSQDGNAADFTTIIKKFHGKIKHIRFEQGRPSSSTMALALHYKRAMDKLLIERNHSHLILCEDDMIFAPDFLKLFEDTAELLENDPTLWCVSSWNDLGMKEYVDDPTRLFRTHYFPGLGWMITQRVWMELSNIWPKDHWDHWMRTEHASKGRECIIPEVSRNYNIGENGVNTGSRGGNFYKDYLARVALNEHFADFGDLSTLHHDNYEKMMLEFVRSAKYIGNAGESNVRRHVEEKSAKLENNIFLITYTAETFRDLAHIFRTHESPRTHHHGTIILKHNAKIYVLADRRVSHYIPEKYQLHPPKSMVITKAKQDTSCLITCKLIHKRCDATLLPFLNSCEVLKKYFPCERGCHGGVQGADLPNYVFAPSKPEFHQMCLMTEITKGCEGSHPTSQRLCPCI